MQNFCQNCKPGFIVQLVRDADFDIRYVYWNKPYCQENCENDLERIATSKVLKIGADYGNCQRVLFIGDSFTDSPWDGQGKSYAEHFLINLSEDRQSCYELVRFAASGSGSDQQFAKLIDVVAEVEPDLVFWQFFYNDMYDNIYNPLFIKKDQKFVRVNALQNSYFWAGWLYQHVFFIKYLKLADVLLYTGENRKDARVDWQQIQSPEQSVINFNVQKYAYLFRQAQALEKEYNFKLFTTLSPLECEFAYPDSCENLSTETRSYLGDHKLQSVLEVILEQNSTFISMYKNDSLTEEQNLNSEDFWHVEKQVGARHLGASGQEKAGRILFLNFVSKF